MTLKSVFARVLCLLFTLPATSFAQFKTTEEASLKINQLFEANLKTFSNQIREKRENMQDQNDEEIFVNRNCEPTSNLFIKPLKKLIATAKTVSTSGHVYIEADLIINNQKPEKFIIDPTYRQFFSVDANQRLRTTSGESSARQAFQLILDQIPTRVLVLPARKLKETLETRFPFLPEWKIVFPYFENPSTYEKYYKNYK